MTGKKVGYVRVSTVEQNESRQLDGLELDKVFTDKASGRDRNRPELVKLLDYVREGDEVYVHSLDRLGRTRGHGGDQRDRPCAHHRQVASSSWITRGLSPRGDPGSHRGDPPGALRSAGRLVRPTPSPRLRPQIGRAHV